MALTIVDRLARREGAWRELDDLLIRLEGGRPVGLEAPRKGSRRRLEPVAAKTGNISEAPVAVNGKGVRFQRLIAEPPAVSEAGLAPKRPSNAPIKTGKLDAAEVLRLGELYRAACADLMIAEAGDMPGDTIASLHRLVARAHNAVYRGRGFRFRGWARELLVETPRRLRNDRTTIVAALAFYGMFFFAALIAAGRPDFARKVCGEEMIDQMEQMYSDDAFHGGDREDAAMAGFYIMNNAGIGLKCMGLGLSFGILTLYELVSEGLILGSVFGYMATTPHWKNFYSFVTAHSAFELTAIVFAGAAGLRIGYSMIDTKGRRRLSSLREEAAAALPTIGASVLLFVLAAFLEGFVSHSSLPYAAKAGIAIACAALLLVYLFLGGRSSSRSADAGAAPPLSI